MALINSACIPVDEAEKEAKETAEELKAPLLPGHVGDPSASTTDEGSSRQEAALDQPSTGQQASEPPSVHIVNVRQAQELSRDLSRALESVQEFWQQQRPMMLLWLGVSIMSFIMWMLMDMGTGIFMLAELGAIVSVVPAACYLFPSFSGGVDLATQAKMTHILGKVAGALDLVTLTMVNLALLSFTSDCSTGPARPADPDMPDTLPCGSIWRLALFFCIILGGHAWFCFTMAKRGHSAQMLLDPVSSGILRL